MGKYVFERHFDDDDQKKTILAHLIHCHDPGTTVTYTVVLAININA